MSRDYKYRIPVYRERRRNRVVRAWGLTALAVGVVAILVFLGVQLFSDAEDGTSDTAAGGPGRPVASLSQATAAVPGAVNGKPGEPVKPGDGRSRIAGGPPEEAETRFSFYKLLPEREVIIPESEIKTLKREESLGRQSRTAPYLVQAGSFASQQDAERMKARLAALRVHARLEMIQLDNTSWYRVKIGPYATLADADKIRQHLRENNIDSVVQKATK